jgi:hypothetical protein
MTILNFLNIGTAEIIILLIGYILFLALIFYILRLSLSINKFLKKLDRQNLLLTEIARKQGVSESDITRIEFQTK